MRLYKLFKAVRPETNVFPDLHVMNLLQVNPVVKRLDRKVERLGGLLYGKKLFHHSFTPELRRISSSAEVVRGNKPQDEGGEDD